MSSTSPIVFRAAHSVGTAYAMVALAALLPPAALYLEGFFPFLGSLFFSGALVLIALRDLGRSSDRSPRLVIDEHHLGVPGFFQAPIPWSAIGGIRVRGKGKYGDFLEFEVSDAQRFGPVQSASRRSTFDELGPVRQALALRDLEGSAADVRHALQRFAPGSIGEVDGPG